MAVATPDEKVFAWAQREMRVIVSCNRNHFLGLARDAIQRTQPFSGLIILIRRRTRQSECAHLLTLLRRAGGSGIKGNINFA